MYILAIIYLIIERKYIFTGMNRNNCLSGFAYFKRDENMRKISIEINRFHNGIIKDRTRLLV